MATFFLTCAILGGGVLVVQLVLAAFGIVEHGAHGHEATVTHGEHAHAGLDLLTVRSLAAGLGFFGLGGLAGLASPFGLLAAVPLAVIAGAVAMFGVALLMRAILRFEDDGSVAIERAVGETGTVYLSIPASGEGTGKVHLTLQNRTVELQAVTTQGALPTGASILVVDIEGPDTVVVVQNPISTEAAHVVR